MHRLQELVRLCRMGVGVRERSRLLRMSTRTERRYRKALEEAGLLEGSADDLPELEVLREVVDAIMPKTEPPARETSVDGWMPQIRTALERGSGPQALWDRLKREEPDFDASLSAVKRAYRRLRKEQGVAAEEAAIPVVTEPGEVAQVDFGFVGRLFDPDSGRIRKAWVFVMVLAFSRHMFAKVVFDQKTATWLDLHVEAFGFFGGVPRTVVPDNLKAAVIRAAFGASDRHEIGLNRSYRELARHYGFKIDPTPVYSPKKKGKVEAAVRYVKRNFFAAGDFETADEANRALPKWLSETAGRRIHGTTGQRPLETFVQRERSALLPLPRARFESVVWKPSTVHPDSHVEFQGKLYSVPWRTIGRRVWVRARRHTVEVYLDDVRIATHDRLVHGRYSTHEAHLPEHRRDLRHRCEQYWLDRADRLGREVGAYVRAVFESDDVLSKLRDVQAIVTYLEPFPPHRAQAACRRADFYGNYTYQGLKRILVRGLDLQPLPTAVIPSHGRLDQPRFARSVDELLQQHLEVDHESH